MLTMRVSVAAAVACLALAGCGTPGSPVPVDSAATNPVVKDPFHIDHPKDLAAVPDPCLLLTSDQVRQLGAGDPKPVDSEWGRACEWHNQDFSAEAAPNVVLGQGLRRAARVDGDDKGNPTAQVSGYPAVHGGMNGIRCSATVGVSDDQSLTVHFTTGSGGRTNPEYADPCGMADKIAGMVLENLPPA